MKSTKFLFLLFIPFIFLSCFEDDDDNGAYASEINDFIWKGMNAAYLYKADIICLLYTSPSPRDRTRSRMPSSA